MNCEIEWLLTLNAAEEAIAHILIELGVEELEAWDTAEALIDELLDAEAISEGVLNN